MHLEAYDRVRERVTREGFTPDLQTRIALFVAASKAVNLPFLALATAAPAGGIAWQALNSQLFRESEALTLLARVTQWSLNPMVYLESAALVAPLSAAFTRAGITGWPGVGAGPGSSLEALALGHATLAAVRLAPIIPATDVATSPFAVALMRIEQENGRLLQTQIRLLKDGLGDMATETREAAIAEKAAMVEAVFARFLETLVAPAKGFFEPWPVPGLHST